MTPTRDITASGDRAISCKIPELMEVVLVSIVILLGFRLELEVKIEKNSR